MVESKILLSKPYNFEHGLPSNVSPNARRFYEKNHGFGYVQIRDEDPTEYNHYNPDDNEVWMGVFWSDNEDLGGGAEGKLNKLREIINDSDAISNLINEAIKDGI